MPARQLLSDLFDAAVSAADPAVMVPHHLPCPPRGRTIVVGAGKAAAAMATAVEAHWPGPLSGLVVTRYGHGAPCQRIAVVEAGHPLPDAAGSDAAARILALVQGLGPDDLVLCLLSGGGSSLLALPAPGLTLADKQALTDTLLRAGAPISDINCVRKHLSAIKGGRLALAAWPAPVVTLAISDVPGDAPSVIASGPTVPDPMTVADARALLDRYAPGATPFLSETPKAGDPHLSRSSFHLIARPRDALDAAAHLANQKGFAVIDLGADVEGEARDVAARHAQLVLKTTAPAVILSGGETTVTVRGRGRGGRNAEYLLALGLALNGLAGVHALAADTDGVDGSEDNAGAFLGPDTLRRAASLGLDGQAMLDDNDAYGFFAGLGDLLVTGPTRTNVNDFRAILVS